MHCTLFLAGPTGTGGTGDGVGGGPGKSATLITVGCENTLKRDELVKVQFVCKVK